METRSGIGAGAQTSFWAVALLLITTGIAVVEGAGDDVERLLIGLGVIVCGVVVIFAKYYLKLPDVSDREMEETIAVMTVNYDRLVGGAERVYGRDLHAFRDEVLKHRAIIEATAALLPPTWQVRLGRVLDSIEVKHGVPD